MYPMLPFGSEVVPVVESAAGRARLGVSWKTWWTMASKRGNRVAFGFWSTILHEFLSFSNLPSGIKHLENNLPNGLQSLVACRIFVCVVKGRSLIIYHHWPLTEWIPNCKYLHEESLILVGPWCPKTPGLFFDDSFAGGIDGFACSANPVGSGCCCRALRCRGCCLDPCGNVSKAIVNHPQIYRKWVV